MVNLGEEIKLARANLGMSQKTLAGLLGVQTQTVWRWEKGEREPSWEMMNKIAKLLNTPHLVSAVNEINDRETMPLGLGYWGSVVDNAREVAARGNSSEISLIYTLLKSGCDELAKVISDEKKADSFSQHFNIHDNTMKANNINVGSTTTETNT